jgi:hypothetical protein
MTTNSRNPQKTFCGLSRESLALLASAQQRLLTQREQRGLPRDWRSVKNLNRLKAAQSEVRNA